MGVTNFTPRPIYSRERTQYRSHKAVSKQSSVWELYEDLSHRAIPDGNFEIVGGKKEST